MFLSTSSRETSGLLRKQNCFPRDLKLSVHYYSFITARDQSMVESGVTGGGKNVASFLFVNVRNSQQSTTQTQSPKLKSNDFQSHPRRETAASGGKRCR